MARARPSVQVSPLVPCRGGCPTGCSGAGVVVARPVRLDGSQGYLGAVPFAEKKSEPAALARYKLGGMNVRQLLLIAQFEVRDAMRSRLVLLTVGLYCLGAVVGSYFFLQAVGAVEEQLLLSAADSSIPLEPGFVRKAALPRLIGALVDDSELAKQLTSVSALALFYAWGAHWLSAPLALLLCAGGHARDRELGSTRYLLTRASRAQWAAGKLLGHSLLLAVGIGLGAIVTAWIALAWDDLDGASALWLFGAVVSAWVYASSYLSIFAGVSLVASSASRARVFGGGLLVLHAIGLAVVESDWALAVDYPVHQLKWLLPPHYKPLLWQFDWGQRLLAVGGLLALGAIGFFAGLSVYRRRDA